MTRHLPVMLAASVLGCTPSATEEPVVALPAPSTLPRAPITCQTVHRAPLGISACMPGKVQGVDNLQSDRERRSLKSVYRSRDTEVEFWLTHLRDLRTKTPLSIKPAPKKDIESARDIELGGLPGQATERIDDETRVHEVVVAAGDTTFSAVVRYPKDAEVDPILVRTFLDSFQVELPHRLYASTEDHFTVSVPGPAIESVTQVDVEPNRSAKRFEFLLGGADERSYGILIESPKAGLRGKAETTIPCWRGKPVSGGEGSHINGAVICHEENRGFSRSRGFLHRGKLYRVEVSSTSREKLTDTESERFFQSFQITER